MTATYISQLSYTYIIYPALLESTWYVIITKQKKQPADDFVKSDLYSDGYGGAREAV